ncbi:hypothetical protein V5O48_019078, partial [Marasmius crinis-equi]
MGWVSFDGVKISNAFFKSVPSFPKLPIRANHPSAAPVASSSSVSLSQLGAIPNPSAGPCPADAVRAGKRKARGTRITIPRATPAIGPSALSSQGGVSEKSLGKRRAVDIVKPNKSSKRLRDSSPVLEHAEPR